MGRYRIKTVSRMLGVRPELLRMWERRYHLFTPQRAGNRYREFDDAQGRSIGELAAEGREALLQRLQPPPSHTALSPHHLALIEECLEYARQLDKGRLETRLAESMAMFPFATLLTEVLTPLMYRLGTLWAAGDLSPASEHLVTCLVTQRLYAMLLVTTPAPDAPVLLCAGVPGEQHALGVLTIAYLLQQQGWHVCYLGVDLPLDALLYSCQRLRPVCVVLSCTYTDDVTSWLALLHSIDTHIAGTYPTYLGGQAIQRYHHLIHLRQAQICMSWPTNIPPPALVKVAIAQ